MTRSELCAALIHESIHDPHTQHRTGGEIKEHLAVFFTAEEILAAWKLSSAESRGFPPADKPSYCVPSCAVCGKPIQGDECLLIGAAHNFRMAHVKCTADKPT